ncbi:MAG: FtsQ-type POTRA domain-containing protein [Oscillospiraceae bacterium]|nr:FtsQ-type POTRA domain-containing protein [Oscillospiraceae bacterium]
MSNKSTTSRDSRVTAKKVRHKRRRINRMRVALLLFSMVVMISVVVGAVLLVSSQGSQNSTQSDSRNAMFGIKNITVEGNTRYTDDQIIKAGDIHIGQSLFLINKRNIAENILKAYPYVDKVTVSNPSFSSIKISIEEVQPVGIISNKSGWLIVGANGKGLEQLSSSSLRLADYRRIKCTKQKGSGVARLTLDNRTLAAVNAIVTAADSSTLDAIKEIDVTDLTDIKLNWKDKINIKLGSDMSLEPKLNYARKTLDRVLSSHGSDASGQIDLSMYSETSPKAVFTPSDLLSNITDTTTTTE